MPDAHKFATVDASNGEVIGYCRAPDWCTIPHGTMVKLFNTRCRQNRKPDDMLYGDKGMITTVEIVGGPLDGLRCEILDGQGDVILIPTANA